MKAPAMKAILELRGQLVVVAEGTSMLPLLHDGDEVAVRAENNLRIGDIALYYGRSGVTLHRIVALENGLVMFLGDHSGTIEKVPRDAVIGRAGEAFSDGPFFLGRPRWVTYLIAKISYASRRKRPGESYPRKVHKVAFSLMRGLAEVEKKFGSVIYVENAIEHQGITI